MKLLPLVCMVALALLLCVGLILAGSAGKDTGENTRVKVAVSGDTENDLLRLGLVAIRTFDDTRFAMELVEMPEAEARKQLQTGGVGAVVIFPEDFLNRALHGDIDQITFLTTPGAQTVVTMLKDEVTKIIADIVVACEKGIYAVDEAIDRYELDVSTGRTMNELGIGYANMLLDRGEICIVKELGISDGLDIGQYYVCSMIVVLMMLFGICFVTIGVKNDYALHKLLASRGLGNCKQVLCEYLVHILALVLVILLLLPVGVLALQAVGEETLSISMSGVMWDALCIRTVLVLAMLAAFNTMIFELSGNLISGVLLHFFCSMGFSYASGCFFPVYTLPVPLQRIASFLPTGVARELLEGAFTGEENPWQVMGVLAFSALFVAVAVLTRHVKAAGLRR